MIYKGGVECQEMSFFFCMKCYFPDVGFLFLKISKLPLDIITLPRLVVSLSVLKLGGLVKVVSLSHHL